MTLRSALLRCYRRYTGLRLRSLVPARLRGGPSLQEGPRARGRRAVARPRRAFGKPTARYAPPAPLTALTDAGALSRHSQHEQSRECRPQMRSPGTVGITSARSPPKRREQPRHREKSPRTTTPGVPEVFSDYTSQKAPGPGEY